MQLFSEKWWEKIKWGTPVSVGLHLLVIVLVLFRLPQETPKPEGEQSINVEIVPPPQPKQEEKPREQAQPKKVEPKKEQPKPQPAPARQQPQAFESAAAKIKQEAKVAELPPIAKAEKKGAVNEAKKAAAADATATLKAAKEEAKAQKQPEVKDPQQQQLAVLSSSTNGDKSAAESKPAAKTEAEKAVPKADPVPVRKPSDDKEKGDATEGKAEAKAKLPADRFVEAKELFSAKSIADPRVKQAMGQLPVKKRILQLCSIEALEQIRNQRPRDFPDMLVPFGPSGGFIGKEQIDASGGAYRSKGTWYDVNFKCKVNLETVEVVSFSYAIGGVVPEASWKSRKLPPN
ncbi:chemotaxis protein histidine kinase CheA [Ensifer adhaerens]|uniref:Chemotaxis protein histidine kinase CheA n=1 Tax=Ensifer adhaerens TaxID=106592 RepID=A0ACC5SVQ7_ENSAD|nr:DUF930 domain-containing protein [Ensifer adhaerens]MBP1872927.1 chemotaxis protein histidine kinase CheA [Ensifer adhaerens]